MFYFCNLKHLYSTMSRIICNFFNINNKFVYLFLLIKNTLKTP